jgi:hypothetical protein
MLSLNNYQGWHTLRHAYGSADSIPKLLSSFKNQASDRKKLWSELSNLLYHQGSIYTASLAALPYLLENAVIYNTDEDFDLICLISAIIVAAECTKMPEAPKEIQDTYKSSLEHAPKILFSALPKVTNDNAVMYVMAALAALGGHNKTAYNLFYADPMISCPNCEATYPRYYDLDEDYRFTGNAPD